jgi:phosphoglycerol transferase MdoB-like AlkP superfamily enzyme
MLKINILMCLLNFLFIFNNYNISTIAPFQAFGVDIVKANSIEMPQINTTNSSDNNNNNNNNNNNIEIIETPVTKEDEIFKEKELEKNLEKEMQIKKLMEEKKEKPEYQEFICGISILLALTISTPKA